MENQLKAPTPPTRVRKAFAAAVAFGAATYLLLAISGIIKSGNRLTVADFGVIVAAALAVGAALRPDLFERVAMLDIAGIKIELREMKKGQIEIQKLQQDQQALLEDVRLGLRLAMRTNEQNHLTNLFNHTTVDYQVNKLVREEIRSLRGMGLVKMLEGKTVGGMPEKVDLAEHVELTEDGLRYIQALLQKQ